MSPSRNADDPGTDASRTRRALLLFARSAPREAREKRLARAQRLFELGRDRVLRAARALEDVELVVAGDLGSGAKLPTHCRRLTQRGGDFGERLRNAFDDVRALGYDSVVAVGNDSPTLETRHLAAAFDALAVAPAVLGECADGGVFLLGARGPAAPLLAGVRWQSPHAFADLVRNAGGAVVLGAVLPDVDGPSSLRELRYWTCDPEVGRLVAEATLRPRGPCSHRSPPTLRTTPRRDAPRGPPPVLPSRELSQGPKAAMPNHRAFGSAPQ